MARLMSVTLTEDAVVERRKTETRRLGWLMLKVGDELDLCRKVMGRRKGDPLVRLARVRVTDVRRNSLHAITDSDVHREGFRASDLAEYGVDPLHVAPGQLADAFVRFFAHHMRCKPETVVTVITWEYLS